MAIEKLRETLLTQDVFSDIIGQDEPKEALKSALLVDRHVIIEGAPGIGKTTLVKSIARHLPPITVVDCSFHCSPDHADCPECGDRKHRGEKLVTRTLSGAERFVRIQGSPDLTVEDLLGDIDPKKALEFGPQSLEAFTPGKLFKANGGILFFDEVNRCSEKLQNALLQVLEEGIATIGSYDIDLPTSFAFIGTMNPEDASGTEKLSEVFLDRFDLVKMAYPEDDEAELRILRKHGQRVEGVRCSDEMLSVIVSFVRSLRNPEKLERMPSVRASIGIYERSQADALVHGRQEVTFANIRSSLETVLAHRIRLRPSLKYLMTTAQFINKELASFMEEHKKQRAPSRPTGSGNEPEGP